MKDSEKYYLSFIFVLFSADSFAQQNETDSLKRLLLNAKADTSKVIYSAQLCSEYWGSGIYDTAMTYGSLSVKLAEKINYIEGMPSSYNSLGLVYYSIANYPLALDYFLRALKINENFLDKALHQKNESHIKKYKTKIGVNYGNIGLIYNSQKDYTKSLEYYMKALHIFSDLGNQSKICIAYGNIANTYRDLKENTKALDYYYKALMIAKERNNKNGIGRNLGNIGIVFYEEKDYEKAKEHFLKALAIALEINDNNRVPIWMENLGMVYFAQNKFSEAERTLLQAQKLYSQVNDREGSMDVNKDLSDLYYKIGKYELSFDRYKASIIIKDSLYNEENSKEIIRKEMNYSFEKKQVQVQADQDKKDAVALSEKKKQEVILYFVIGGLGIVLLFALFIYRSLIQIRKKNLLITEQKKHIEEKQKEILDSIHYAARIQRCILPTEKYISQNLKRLMKN